MTNAKSILKTLGIGTIIGAALYAIGALRQEVDEAKRLGREECQVTCNSRGQRVLPLRNQDQFSIPLLYTEYYVERRACEQDCGYPINYSKAVRSR
jgi:hypothetical protein